MEKCHFPPHQHHHTERPTRHVQHSSTDRVTKLFMLVCICFCVTSMKLTYDNYFGGEIIENEEEADLHDEVQYQAFKARDRRVNMEDTHAHEYDDDTVAKKLYNNVRVLCWIMTSPKNLDKKGYAVKMTWAKRCNKYIFFSSVTNDSFPTIGLNVSEGREHLTAKTVQAFKYCYEHYGDSFDWFLKADDDTYVIVENLRYFLSHHDPNDLVYFGHRFKTIVKQGYFSGGAGYVFSRRTLEKFVNVGIRNPLLCRRDGGAEDAEIGKCMQKLNVKVGDSIDKHERESFHPFKLIAHLQGDFPYWFYDYTYHPSRKGPDCCSDYSVTFHYMSPADMYLMDFLIYHLRPYGLLRKDSTDPQFISTKLRKQLS